MDPRSNRPVSTELHPAVFKAIAGLTLLLIFSVWLFAGDGYGEFLASVVTGFLLLTLFLPRTLWRVGGKHAESDEMRQNPPTFHDWSHGDLHTGGGRMSGAEATLEALTPIGAVAIGMMLFGLLFNAIMGAQ
ncbi:hypothetical protein [Terrarubrum flagellatum]|uniref:hypothetical protein n=1 Tax=Terrirubrum flagellatum TaxID=2895980 RepID=UPI0031457081